MSIKKYNWKLKRALTVTSPACCVQDSNISPAYATESPYFFGKFIATIEISREPNKVIIVNPF